MQRINSASPSEPRPKSVLFSTARDRFARVTSWINRLRVAIATYVPLGYQDATGFHYGISPRDRLCSADSASSN